MARKIAHRDEVSTASVSGWDQEEPKIASLSSAYADGTDRSQATNTISLRPGFKTPLNQQRLNDRIAAAEVTKRRRHVLRATARQNQVAKTLAVDAGQSAVLLEPVEGVVIQDLAPQISVVAG